MLRIKPKLISTTAPLGQAFRDNRLFVLELGAPVSEALQRQPVKLTIFTLVQIAVAPCLQVLTPECLSFRRRARPFRTIPHLPCRPHRAKKAGTAPCSQVCIP